MTYNLRAAAKMVIDSNESTDPGELADILFPDIPIEEHAGLLRSLLRGVIREIQAADFRSSAPELAQRVEVEMFWVDDDNDPNMLPKPRTKSRSRFAATIRAEYAAWLDATVDVAGLRIRRGALTFSDLMTVAAARRGLAQANTLVAEELEYHAELLHQHGVETVGELPADVLKKLAGV